MVTRIPMHIKAKMGDIAERVIISGDPDRIRQLSLMLNDVRVVNENRGYITYTGRYAGKNVTIACHGIGAPSIAIVVEELNMLGAKYILRLGTAGGLLKEMRYGEILIANGAFSGTGGTLGAYSKRCFPIPTIPSFELFDAVIKASNNSKSKVYIGPVMSSDAFYEEDENIDLSKCGYFAVEMESSTLFAISKIRGFKSAALFMISNNLINNTELIDAKTLKQHLENAANIAFNAITSI